LLLSACGSGKKPDLSREPAIDEDKVAVPVAPPPKPPPPPPPPSSPALIDPPPLVNGVAPTL
ncbi:MAG: hypothetical protein IT383_14825, partial [Deltaproteobacteria bacterium]|nr:hypothetical protein [Deltaproteobacteria bacterium]